MQSKLRFTKTKADQFFKAVTGSSKGMNKKDHPLDVDTWCLQNGHIRYMAWISKGAIYCQLFLSNQCIDAFYCNFETCEIDWKLTDEHRDAVREESRYEGRERLVWQLKQVGIEVPESIEI